jgi:UDPglucose--hexose-1-phosphate uridylyltransferase
MSINYLINQLVKYGVKEGLIDEYDMIYCANRLIDIFNLNTFEFEETEDIAIHELLEKMCDYAFENKIIDSNDVTVYDLFDTKLMDVLMPTPSTVKEKFYSKFNVDKVAATNYFYDLAIKSNYIRMDRINKNICFKHDSDFGLLDITINLSKPEKDPKLIALAKSMPSAGYPKCALCYENMGFAGNLNQAARQNHRILPIKLDNEDYFFQYSPYVYYNEHTIVFNKKHTPMVINKEIFSKLLDFVRQIPHYFVGSNADLPIVGGSILSHDHFQGGNYEFPMFTTNVLKSYEINGYKNVKFDYINWPLDTICLSGENKEEIVSLADKILISWKQYSHEEINVYSHTNDTPHNTITPIARNNNGKYELYLVLRNNKTTEEHPEGLFHPYRDLHHIKKENIGLIEVMGLAVLPKRLKEEMDLLKNVLLNNGNFEEEILLKHKEWALMLKEKYHFTKENIDQLIEYEIGEVFKQVLQACGVFKFSDRISAMDRFVNTL